MEIKKRDSRRGHVRRNDTLRESRATCTVRHKVCDSAASGLPSKNSLQSRADAKDGHGIRGHVYRSKVFTDGAAAKAAVTSRASQPKGVRRIPCTRGIHAENSGHVNLGKSYERLSLDRLVYGSTYLLRARSSCTLVSSL